MRSGNTAKKLFGKPPTGVATQPQFSKIRAHNKQPIGDKTMYFSGLHHDSSPVEDYKYYGERYTVSTVHVCDHWETCVFGEEESEVVWVGFDETAASVKAEHDKWVKLCRSGEFKFEEDE